MELQWCQLERECLDCWMFQSFGRSVTSGSVAPEAEKGIFSVRCFTFF